MKYCVMKIPLRKQKNALSKNVDFFTQYKPIGASPGRDYVLTRMVINILVLYMVRNDTSNKGGDAPRATD
jgi:hypothetical protein